MKRFTASVLLLGAFLLAGTVSAQALTFQEYRDKVMELRAGKFTPREMVDLSQAALIADVGNDAFFKRVVISGLWEALILMDDDDSALAVAEDSIREFPTVGHGYMLKSDVYALLLDQDNAVATLREGLAQVGAPDEKKKMEERIADMPFRINRFVPLWTDFAENHDAADKIYKDKQVYGRGIVTDVARSGSGEEIILSFQTDANQPIGIQCYFPASAPGVADIKEGQGIYYQGLCRGMTFGRVVLNNCTLDEQ